MCTWYTECCTTTQTRPLDRYQVHVIRPHAFATHAGSLTCAEACGCMLLREEGLKGLWKGIGPNVARNAIVNAAELASYDQVSSVPGFSACRRKKTVGQHAMLTAAALLMVLHKEQSVVNIRSVTNPSSALTHLLVVRLPDFRRDVIGAICWIALGCSCHPSFQPIHPTIP